MKKKQETAATAAADEPALAIGCPFCEAPAGVWCHRSNGSRKAELHHHRLDAWEGSPASHARVPAAALPFVLCDRVCLPGGASGTVLTVDEQRPTDGQRPPWVQLAVLPDGTGPVSMIGAHQVSRITDLNRTEAAALVGRARKRIPPDLWQRIERESIPSDTVDPTLARSPRLADAPLQLAPPPAKPRRRKPAAEPTPAAEPETAPPPPTDELLARVNRHTVERDERGRIELPVLEFRLRQLRDAVQRPGVPSPLAQEQIRILEEIRDDALLALRERDQQREAALAQYRVEARGALAQADADLEEVRAQLRRSQDQARSLSDARDLAGQQIDALNADVERLEAQLALTPGDRLVEARRERDAALLEVRTTDAALKARAAELVQAEAQLAVARPRAARTEKAEAQLDTLQRLVSDLRNERDAARIERNEAERGARLVRQERDQLRTELAAARRLAELRAQTGGVDLAPLREAYQTYQAVCETHNAAITARTGTDKVLHAARVLHQALDALLAPPAEPDAVCMSCGVSLDEGVVCNDCAYRPPLAEPEPDHSGDATDMVRACAEVDAAADEPVVCASCDEPAPAVPAPAIEIEEPAPSLLATTSQAAAEARTVRAKPPRKPRRRHAEQIELADAALPPAERLARIKPRQKPCGKCGGGVGEVHACCPKCSTRAVGEADLRSLFGTRLGGAVAQSLCKRCRSDRKAPPAEEVHG